MIFDIGNLIVSIFMLSLIKHFMGFEQMVLIGVAIIMYRLYKIQSYCEQPEDTTSDENNQVS
jgi:hypothetical protein